MHSRSLPTLDKHELLIKQGRIYRIVQYVANSNIGKS